MFAFKLIITLILALISLRLLQNWGEASNGRKGLNLDLHLFKAAHHSYDVSAIAVGKFELEALYPKLLTAVAEYFEGYLLKLHPRQLVRLFCSEFE